MNAARDGMTVADLIKSLSAYSDDLRVRFTSSESGGFWPKGKQVMGVFISEQIFSVTVPNPSAKLEPADFDHLEISLLAVTSET